MAARVGYGMATKGVPIYDTKFRLSSSMFWLSLFANKPFYPLNRDVVVFCALPPSNYGCKCGVCNHSSKTSCIHQDCDCCNLEDMFSLLTHFEFEPRHLKNDHRDSPMLTP